MFFQDWINYVFWSFYKICFLVRPTSIGFKKIQDARESEGNNPPQATAYEHIYHGMAMIDGQTSKIARCGWTMAKTNNRDLFFWKITIIAYFIPEFLPIKKWKGGINMFKCPHPLKQNHGSIITVLCCWHVALVPFLHGNWQSTNLVEVIRSSQYHRMSTSKTQKNVKQTRHKKPRDLIQKNITKQTLSNMKTKANCCSPWLFDFAFSVFGSIAIRRISQKQNRTKAPNHQTANHTTNNNVPVVWNEAGKKDCACHETMRDKVRSLKCRFKQFFAQFLSCNVYFAPRWPHFLKFLFPFFASGQPITQIYNKQTWRRKHASNIFWKKSKKETGK